MSATAIATTPNNMSLCRYYARGICRFGDMCRFSHDLSLQEGSADATGTAAMETVSTGALSSVIEPAKPSTSKSWVNAPIFIPRNRRGAADHLGLDSADGESENVNRTWAEVAGGGVGHVNINTHSQQGMPMPLPGGICPYEYECPYGPACTYQHIELCEMCDTYCLHPTDMQQRRKHIQDCLQQHERDMELSFAIARSKDKTCGICFDTIMEKSGREKRFGILPNCSHIFCLECIRKWRQAKQFEHKITRACPECRVASDFVCPSAFWVDTKEEKEKLLVDYRAALGVKDCKYFKKGDGKCPFGNKCFYKHALPNGDLVDVGCPQRARKLHRATDDLIDLLDIYLWEFVDQRDYHWLDMHSNPTDSDDSDWSDE